MYCPKCYKMLQEGVKFCPECGFPVTSETQALWNNNETNEMIQKNDIPTPGPLPQQQTQYAKQPQPIQVNTTVRVRSESGCLTVFLICLGIVVFLFILGSIVK